MRPPFRPGTWRQAIVTLSAVLPVSLLLHFGPRAVTESWPQLAVVVVNATLLVAVLNWGLLPVFHWLTHGWATRTPAEARFTETVEDRGRR